MNRPMAVLLLASGLGGCFFGGDGEIKTSCDEPQPYQSERLGAPLQTPEGLDPLNANREMPIPKAQSAPKPPGSDCITTPPSIRTQ